jgi:hypothetical protein
MINLVNWKRGTERAAGAPPTGEARGGRETSEFYRATGLARNARLRGSCGR